MNILSPLSSIVNRVNYPQIIHFINLVFATLLFFSCQREIPEETRKFLHGAWAQEGFTDSLRKMHSYDDVLDALGDTIGIINIDLCYGDRPEEKKYFSKPENADSLTDEERYARNYIWVLEDNYPKREKAFRLYYKGDNYFLSDPLPDGNRKFCKIISMKDKKVEYGLVDKNKNIKSSCYLELLFHAKHWYYERFDFGWGELESSHMELSDFYDENFIYGATGVSLYKRNNPTDNLIQTFSIDDVQNKPNIQISSKIVWIEPLRSRLKYIDEDSIDGIDPQKSDYFILTWKGDTATIENYRLDGEYYLVLKRD